MQAIKQCNIARVKELVEMKDGADVCYEFSYEDAPPVSNTPIHLAVYLDNFELVQYLTCINLEKTSKMLSMINGRGETPLMLAAFTSSFKIVEYLFSLDKKQITMRGQVNDNFEWYDEEDWNLYAFALMRGAADYEPYYTFVHGETAELRQKMAEERMAIIDFFVQQGVDTKDIAGSKFPAIHFVIKNSFLFRDQTISISLIKSILRRYPEAIEDLNATGLTPYLLAAAEGELDILKFLSSQPGNKPSARDENGKTALLLAAENVRINVFNYLLTESHPRSDIEEQDKNKQNVFTLALNPERFVRELSFYHLENPNRSVSEFYCLLFREGVYLNLQDKTLTSFLSFSLQKDRSNTYAFRGDKDSSESLNVRFPDLILAAISLLNFFPEFGRREEPFRKTEFDIMLLRLGSALNAREAATGNTALHMALQEFSPEKKPYIFALLEAGARVDLPNRKKETALQYLCDSADRDLKDAGQLLTLRALDLDLKKLKIQLNQLKQEKESKEKEETEHRLLSQRKELDNKCAVLLNYCRGILYDALLEKRNEAFISYFTLSFAEFLVAFTHNCHFIMDACLALLKCPTRIMNQSHKRADSFLKIKDLLFKERLIDKALKEKIASMLPRVPKSSKDETKMDIETTTSAKDETKVGAETIASPKDEKKAKTETTSVSTAAARSMVSEFWRLRGQAQSAGLDRENLSKLTQYAEEASFVYLTHHIDGSIHQTYINDTQAYIKSTSNSVFKTKCLTLLTSEHCRQGNWFFLSRGELSSSTQIELISAVVCGMHVSIVQDSIENKEERDKLTDERRHGMEEAISALTLLVDPSD